MRSKALSYEFNKQNAYMNFLAKVIIFDEMTIFDNLNWVYPHKLASISLTQTIIAEFQITIIRS